MHKFGRIYHLVDGHDSGLGPLFGPVSYVHGEK
jgi:hypothetical protein